MFENEKQNENCDGQGTMIAAIISSIILALIAVLGFYNSYSYLYKMRKYKAYALTLCYVACQITLLAAIARVTMIAIGP